MSITDRLDQIEARAKAATEGPWESDEYTEIDPDGFYELSRVIAPDPDDEENCVIGVVHVGILRPDATFIAHARTDVPYLIGQVRWLLDELSAAVADNEKKDAALRAVLEHVKEMEADIPHDGSNSAANHAGRLIRRAIEEALR